MQCPDCQGFPKWNSSSCERSRSLVQCHPRACNCIEGCPHQHSTPGIRKRFGPPLAFEYVTELLSPYSPPSQQIPGRLNQLALQFPGAARRIRNARKEGHSLLTCPSLRSLLLVVGELTRLAELAALRLL